MATKGIVWILGAGFSKFLGAPLLENLLTRRSAADLRAAYAGRATLSQVLDLEEVASIYEHGKEQKLWAHAEEFLERIDSHGVQHRVMQRRVADVAKERNLKRDKLKLVRDLALRMLVAEVSIFLAEADVGLERWAPYRAWVSDLAPNDTVLTFNYDLVPDLLSAGVRRLSIPGPHAPVGDEPTRSDPLVLKLHGSVGWKLDSPELLSIEECLSTSIEDQVIATPGIRKHRMISKDGPLFALWNQAATAIQHAEAVVFVGYRIPPTDAGTKQWFVDMLRARTKDIMPTHEAPLPVHIVLGPADPNPDAARLQNLLECIAMPKKLLVHAPWRMGAEDFLGLVGRSTILNGQN